MNEVAIIGEALDLVTAERDALRARLATCAAELHAARLLAHPAAQQLPSPTGTGTDVHAWLMERCADDKWNLAGDAVLREYFEADCACDELGWDLREALEARHEFGVKKWGGTLRTNDGQPSLQAWAQERLDALVYRVKWWLEGEGL